MFRSFLALLILYFAVPAKSFSATRQRSFRSNVPTMDDSSSRPYAMSTVAPSREDVETERRTGRDDGDFLGDKEENFDDAVRTQGPLEWLEDSAESREIDDPYHILLLGQTFEKPKITVPYVAGSLNYVMEMPVDEATELSQFSFDHGMSCLGTWSREECLSLGRRLQVRDIVCRVVPYCEGGQRGWQAKDASNDFSNLQDAN